MPPNHPHPPADQFTIPVAAVPDTTKPTANISMSFWERIKCPVLEIGKNSVNPATNARITVLNNTNTSITFPDDKTYLFTLKGKNL
jgi:hypothetical protein